MKYRIKFSKEGPIKYIGHLDVMRYFQKAIRRAELPVKYSEGFSPHQVLSFAFPLSVGYTSEGEYFDVEMTDMVKTEEIKNMLNSVMVPGISIMAVKELEEKSKNCMASVFAAKYEIAFAEGFIKPDNFKKRVIDYFSQLTIPVNKPKKKGGGTVDINLKEFIYDFGCLDNGIYFTVNASSSDNIKPSFVVSCLFDYLGLKIDERDYFVKRIDILGNKSADGIELVSLLDI